MATNIQTGILYRRGSKSYLISNPPVPGEIVFSTDTEEYGALQSGEIVWRKHYQDIFEADKLKNKFKITLEGDVQGEVQVDGSEDVTINCMVTLPEVSVKPKLFDSIEFVALKDQVNFSFDFPEIDSNTVFDVYYMGRLLSQMDWTYDLINKNIIIDPVDEDGDIIFIRGWYI